jgi:hypothetical protein
MDEKRVSETPVHETDHRQPWNHSTARDVLQRTGRKVGGVREQDGPFVALPLVKGFPAPLCRLAAKVTVGRRQ